MLNWKWRPMGMLASMLSLLLAGSPARCAENQELLRFGRVSVEDPSVTLGKYKPLITALGKYLGCNVELVQASSYADMTGLFKSGKVQLGIMNAYSYTQISEDSRFIPVVKRMIGKASEYRCYIIVRNDIHAASLKDLKGRSFGFSELNSTTGYLLPCLMLRKNGLAPDRDLSRVSFVAQHDSIILAVANRSLDAAAVASYIFDDYDKQVTGKMRILAQSDPIPYGPVVARRDLGPERIRKIRDFFLTLHDSEWGREALAESGFSGFVPARSRDYDIIRKASALLGKQAAPP